MGFLNFLKGKKEDDAKEQLDIPPPPPASGEAEMPSFEEEGQSEDLKLPDIPELGAEQTHGPEIPEISETFEPHMEKTTSGMAPEIPKMQTVEMAVPVLTEPKAEDIYKQTPVAPRIAHPPVSRPTLKLHVPEPRSAVATPTFLMPRMPTPELSRHTGQVFIKGEDYRELLEGLDAMLAAQKEKLARQERDVFRAEEREHDRLLASIEDLHHTLMLTEGMLFE